MVQEAQSEIWYQDETLKRGQTEGLGRKDGEEEGGESPRARDSQLNSHRLGTFTGQPRARYWGCSKEPDTRLPAVLVLPVQCGGGRRPDNYDVLFHYRAGKLYVGDKGFQSVCQKGRASWGGMKRPRD